MRRPARHPRAHGVIPAQAGIHGIREAATGRLFHAPVANVSHPAGTPTRFSGYAGRMPKSKLAPVLAAGAVLVLAFLLNPSPERHRLKIKEATGERSPIAGMLGLGALAAFASNYHSLGVASYTRAGDRILSVGVLGVVFVPQ